MAIAEEAEETDEDGAVGSTAVGSSTDTGTDEGTTTDTADDGRYTRKRCVLITGCSSGIGRATARAFLQNEWLVVATSRDPEDIADLDELGCETLALDVTDPEQVASVVERTVDLGGAIDCLVNNAGYGQMGPLEDVSTAELHRQFDVNVYGPHRLTRAALPHMRAQGKGRIVNVSSVLGRMAFAGTGAYSGAKHALEAMSDALRAEAEEFGVEVVLIEPGTVETEFTERVDDELPPEETRTPAYESLYEMIEEARLIGGSGPLAISPEEVAAAILHAGTCPEPPARYPVGPLAEYGIYVRYLPDSLRDAAYGLLRRLV
ncbi:SDR family oxidoreductase [Natrononativus amylolyticus]|uniref:SDR family oxidoreductase n=1 Tax=Natrononativus amylolyticus TaxID=2963434 RepID=UPI0020CDC1B3|nr:SDR family oxidoreductase [Natrononativus amylolyticus]